MAENNRLREEKEPSNLNFILESISEDMVKLQTLYEYFHYELIKKNANVQHLSTLHVYIKLVQSSLGILQEIISMTPVDAPHINMVYINTTVTILNIYNLYVQYRNKQAKKFVDTTVTKWLRTGSNALRGVTAQVGTRPTVTRAERKRKQVVEPCVEECVPKKGKMTHQYVKERIPESGRKENHITLFEQFLDWNDQLIKNLFQDLCFDNDDIVTAGEFSKAEAVQSLFK